MGYSLWLMPSDAQRSALAWLMEYRPSSYLKNPRSYSSKSFPHFEPHITLANLSLPFPPSLDMLLPPRLERVVARFKSLHVGNKYLSSLSVTVKKTPDLMTLHDTIDAHLKLNNIENRGGRFPHMSLFYLDEAVPGDRQRLPERLQRRGLVTSTREGILLNCFLDDAAFVPVSLPSFNGEEIWLVDCNGPVAEWKMLDKRRLPYFDARPAVRVPPPLYAPPVVPPIGQNNPHRDSRAPFPSTDLIVSERQQFAPPPRQVVHGPLSMHRDGNNKLHRDDHAQFISTEPVQGRQRRYSLPAVLPILRTGKSKAHKDGHTHIPLAVPRVPERRRRLSQPDPRQLVNTPLTVHWAREKPRRHGRTTPLPSAAPEKIPHTAPPANFYPSAVPVNPAAAAGMASRHTPHPGSKNSFYITTAARPSQPPSQPPSQAPARRSRVDSSSRFGTWWRGS
ncbi:hypothetical protein MVEN_01770000 [Mycena venus]|uniref:2',3'-cyclic-nucleotide 3'-phosphodiesterase n=1 Tax=Mycena venus TaxID=2733690 RepID=A0A8H7CPE1_9AGAR|nr:hypothetical protein MVEN_01770000 [Mycena venus]